jgi:hypothetical protein
MSLRQHLQNPPAFPRDVEGHAPPVLGIGSSDNETLCHGTVNQFDGAVMTEAKPSGYIRNACRGALRGASHLKQ